MISANYRDAKCQRSHAKYLAPHAKSFAKSLILHTQSNLAHGVAQSGAKSRKVQCFQGLERTQSTSRKVHPYGGGDALRAPPCPSWFWGRENGQDVHIFFWSFLGPVLSVRDTSIALGDIPL